MQMCYYQRTCVFFHADRFFFDVRYDGDPIIGHRLYREVVKVGFKQKWKGKGRLTQPAIDSWWETLATNLKEFRELSVRSTFMLFMYI